MKRKKILRDAGFWLLIGTNLYLVYHYTLDPAVFTTLVWVYWTQSILLGLFNFADMLTVRSVLPGSFTWTSKYNEEKELRKAPAAFIFLVAYCFMHLVYFIGVLVTKETGPFRQELFNYFVLAFAAGQALTFIEHKLQQRKASADLGAMFAMPFMRILPMHIVLLLPVFFHSGYTVVFLLLKSIADVVMYVYTKRAGNSREADAATLAIHETEL